MRASSGIGTHDPSIHAIQTVRPVLSAFLAYEQRTLRFPYNNGAQQDEQNIQRQNINIQISLVQGFPTFFEWWHTWQNLRDSVPPHSRWDPHPHLPLD
jgi:hypothetical protein